MEEIYLPVLSHFQNENVWIASLGKLRFKVTPKEDGLAVELWEGPWAYEFSKVEDTRVFPLTDEGIEELRGWLGEKAAEYDARPPRSLAEELERRGKKEG